jgi:GH15 family glucan-1,4-alpha-glucosidase
MGDGGDSWARRDEDGIAAHLAKIWLQPDKGIWESRDEPKHYTYSKVMAWVGIDRFLKLAKGRLAADHKRDFEILRQTIHADICDHAFDAARNRFGASYGSDELDAALLRLPLVGFLPPDDPRILGTVDAIERELAEGGLVRRKARKPDGPDEGVFLACTCWLADCLVMQGREAEARAYFERLLAVRNDVGLLAEEFDPQTRQLIGNFPQTISHVALINTALRLNGVIPRRASTDRAIGHTG